MGYKVLLAGIALLLASCSKQKPLEPAIQAVRAGVVEQIQADVPERYSATIQPNNQVSLAFKSGGIIDRLLQVRGVDGRIRAVEAGDHVAKDAALAQVRPLDYQDSLAQADAQHAQAQSQRQQAESQLAQARAQLGPTAIARSK